MNRKKILYFFTVIFTVVLAVIIEFMGDSIAVQAQSSCESYCRDSVYRYGVFNSRNRICDYTLRRCENGCDERGEQCRASAIPSLPTPSPDSLPPAISPEVRRIIEPEKTATTVPARITTSSNLIFDQDSRRGEFFFQENKEQRKIEIRTTKDLDVNIAEDRRILIKKGGEEYKIEPRFKELIAKYTRREETVKDVSLEINEKKPVYVLEKMRKVKIFGLFSCEEKIKDTINAADLKLIKSEKPWWSIFAIENKSQPDSQLGAYSCGNSVCEIGETGISTKQDTAFYCPYDCGYSGDGVCGADEFNLTEKSYVSYSEDCLPACGNKTCEPGESLEVCPYDCGPTACGNQECEWSESPAICPEDCGTACGNGICEKGEGPAICKVDCGLCGDGVCQGSEFNGGYCQKDCANACLDDNCGDKEKKITCENNKINCGNGVCEGTETAKICSEDCFKPAEIKYLDKYKNNPAFPECGNSICGAGESLADCPVDCPPPICGNGICDATENTANCSDDCANVCGDNICNKGESYLACPCDCSFCGDGVCGVNEEKCQLDCAL